MLGNDNDINTRSRSRSSSVFDTKAVEAGHSEDSQSQDSEEGEGNPLLHGYFGRREGESDFVTRTKEDPENRYNVWDANRNASFSRKRSEPTVYDQCVEGIVK